LGIIVEKKNGFPDNIRSEGFLQLLPESSKLLVDGVGGHSIAPKTTSANAASASP